MTKRDLCPFCEMPQWDGLPGLPPGSSCPGCGKTIPEPEGEPRAHIPAPTVLESAKPRVPGPTIVEAPASTVVDETDPSVQGAGETVLEFEAEAQSGSAKTVLDTPAGPPEPARTVADPSVSQEGALSGNEGPQAWIVGDVILDLYEVQSVLGQGGMGTVYRVLHRGWRRELAVKTPRPDVFGRPGAIENFERECETWIDLGLHPHIVSCHYVRRVEGLPRIFAEFVEGGSLEDWIRDGRLYEGGSDTALERILDIALQFSRGLAHSHDLGVVHQDVKPDNVMMTATGTAKVTDFGLARARAVAGDASGAIPGQSLLVSTGGGTPSYWPPEQAGGRATDAKVTRRADIYSWAVSVLEMFTEGVTWADGRYAGQALASVRTGQAGENQDCDAPPLPESLAVLLEACLQESPDRRPRNLGVVEEHLERCYAGLVGHPYARPKPRAGRDTAGTLNNRALSLLDLGKREEAFELWARALQTEAHHPESTFNSGLERWRADEIGADQLVSALEEVRQSHTATWRDEYLLALVHLENRNPGEALRVLEEIEPTVREQQEELSRTIEEAGRRFERQPRHLKPFGGQGEVRAIALSGSGRVAVAAVGTKRFVSSASGQVPLSGFRVEVWDTGTPSLLGNLVGHEGGVNALQVSTDGRWAFSGGADGDVRAWDLETFQCARVLSAGEHSPVVALGLAGDGRTLVCGLQDRRITVFDIATGNVVKTWSAGGSIDRSTSLTSLDISPDARFVVVGASETQESIKQRRTARKGMIHKPNITIRGVVILRDRQTGTTWQQNVSTRRVAVSRDGRFVVAAGLSGITLFDTVADHRLWSKNAHELSLTAIKLTPDGRFLLTAGIDGAVRTWEIPSGRLVVGSPPLRTGSMGSGGRPPSAYTVALALDSEARWAISGLRGQQTLRFWETGCVNPFRAPLVPSGVVAVEEILTGQAQQEEEIEAARKALERKDHCQAARHIRAAREVTGRDRDPEAVRLWTALYRRLPRAGLRGAWEDEGFWRIGDQEAKAFGIVGTAISMSGDGRLLLTGDQARCLKVWDTTTGEAVKSFMAHSSTVLAAAISQDGRLAVSVSGPRKFKHLEDDEHVLKCWDLETGECFQQLRGHEKNVTCIVLTPDSRIAVSRSDDGTLRGWDLRGCRPLWVRSFPGRRIGSVMMTADGATVMCPHTKGHTDSMLEAIGIHDGKTLWSTAIEGIPCPLPDERSLLVLGSQTTRKLDSRTGEVLALGSDLSSDPKRGLSGRFVTVTATGRSVIWVRNPRVDSWVGGVVDTDSWETVRTLQGREQVDGLVLSPDDAFLVMVTHDGGLHRWVLDWELEEREPADWDEAAHPFLDRFLQAHTPRHPTTGKQMGQIAWTDRDLERLLDELGARGLGWVSAAGVRRRLEEGQVIECPKCGLGGQQNPQCEQCGVFFEKAFRAISGQGSRKPVQPPVAGVDRDAGSAGSRKTSELTHPKGWLKSPLGRRGKENT